MNTIFAYKQAMTQTWDKTGKRLPVVQVLCPPMLVTQVKTVENDGYLAVQVGFGERPGKYSTQSVLKHLKKKATDMVPRTLQEIRLTQPVELKVGETVNVSEVLSVGDLVAVSGVSKGRGFAGVVKRHGFSGGPRTHGQSDRERAPGAIGQGTSPGRIHKGKRMAGHYGVQQFTIKNLQVIKLDPSTGETWLSGPIPGYRGTLLTIKKIRNGKFSGLFEPGKNAVTDKAVSAPAVPAGIEPGPAVSAAPVEGTGLIPPKSDPTPADKPVQKVK
jgi:large subunit ribosomal protein L3